MKRTMGKRPAQRFPLVYNFTSFSAERPIGKTFPYVIDSLRRRMKHVGFVKTVVTQFVCHNLISREIMAGTGKTPAQFISSQLSKAALLNWLP